MDKHKQRLHYLFSDFCIATLVWVVLNELRYVEIAQHEGFGSPGSFFGSYPVLKGQVLIPFFWLVLYYFSGYYNRPFGKSRIDELFGTFVTVSIGVVVIFFYVILNDLPESFDIYYTIFFTYYLMQFVLTYACRVFITSWALRKARRREWMPNVLVIGAGSQAVKVQDELQQSGYRVTGFVRENERIEPMVDSDRLLGTMDDLPLLMATYLVDELVIVPGEQIPDDEIIRILYSLYHYNRPIKIRTGKNNPLFKAHVKTVHDIPFVEVTANNFSEAGKNIKNAADKLASVLALTLLSPLYAYIAFRVKRSSRGPVFFRQERIGYMGRPFMICKFRTMYADASQQDPLLTEKDDPRVTPFGRFLRKYRLDELPQFWNVLKGDMSVVGPRPEQRYYIGQIVRKAPYYYLLHNVRPGITSWGMVKYGYAETVDKMIERLQYDIMYYENMSLALDITILVYTIKIVLTGKGV
ncbi:MAG: sugar transferase [Tannerella sp.]|jgi:exopolysaccharide biosynthesis polyprenyl glycosylphosphotransferase|nr:sugar transferase [Tannerella sp.]